jgi:hypothetical protein
MRAAMTDQHEAKRRWLDFARDYERQADQIETTDPNEHG